MNVITLDFESHYSDDYTLSKMTTEAYVRDPRFEALGCAVRWGDASGIEWWPRDDLPMLFEHKDEWAKAAILCHHSSFDGLILSHHYGIKPKLWLDTLSMARLLLGNHLSVGLDALAKHYGLAAKTVPYNLFRGKHWNELSTATQKMVGDGACHDVALTWQLFNILAKDFPRSQYAVVDIMIRMFVEPRLKGDIDVFARLWESENNKKTSIMEELGVTETDLQSADRFAAILRQYGIEPEMKDGKNGEIYAFAKTDPFMVSLQEHEDDTVQSLATARLGVKSTIQQTRAATLGWMARRGDLTVYLRPYGAKTTRPSGGDKSNFLNLKRDDPDFDTPDKGVNIKQGICAPDGFLLAPVDSSQVECRILNVVAGQDDVVENFRLGKDPYVMVASAFYGYPVNKKDHPAERQTGKIIELQSGYGSGGEKIRATLRTKAGILITPEEGIKARDAYRNTHPAVTDLWNQGGRMIARLAGGDPIDWGPVHIRDHRMWLPNGCPLIYDTLEYYRDPNEQPYIYANGKVDLPQGYWRIKTRRGWEKLYGSKLVENMIQALAWVIVSDAMVRIHNLGYRILNVPYDELLVLVPRDGREETHLQVLLTEMRRTPDWLPGLPLDAEGGLSERYSK